MVLVLMVHFNSIKVRLKLNNYQSLGVDFDYFNSIKVRLKQPIVSTELELLKFQFHKGTIKTNNKSCFILYIYNNFNSIKVRLKQRADREYGELL